MSSEDNGLSMHMLNAIKSPNRSQYSCFRFHYLANVKKRSGEALSAQTPSKLARGNTVTVHPFFTSPQAAQSKGFEISWNGSTSLILNAASRDFQPRGHTKIAAFDLDGTLILTASGRVFPKDETDWRWFHTSVPRKLESLHQQGYTIAILSNQNGLNSDKRIEGFKRKIGNILSQLSMPVMLIAALKKDVYRKPATAMWDLLYEKVGSNIEVKNSYYVGDAAGRAEGWKHKARKDHSCGDRKFADNIGIKFYTPEEFFLNQEPIEFTWGPFNPKTYTSEALLFSPADTPLIPEDQKTEVIVFVGSPAVGKSTFALKHLVSKGYEYVNQDTLKTREKCVAACENALREGKSVVIDNTNPDQAARAVYVKCAKAANARVRCFWFTSPVELAQHNNAYRAYNASTGGRELLSGIAFNLFKSKLQEPKLTEGFEEIKKINFVLDGTEEEKIKWQQWWN